MKLKTKIKKNGGMTYVELIVVLSIFATMSAVSIYNYGAFQGKVDAKNLASDIASKIVEAQRASLNGKLPEQLPDVDPWKPSYGVYFRLALSTAVLNETKDSQLSILNSILELISNKAYAAAAGDNRSFIYFTDLDQSGGFNGTMFTCATSPECLESITLPKNNVIANIKVIYNPGNSNNTITDLVNDLTITFKRPNSTAEMTSTGFNGVGHTLQYFQITVRPPKGPDSLIKVYPSGRIQVD